MPWVSRPGGHLPLPPLLYQRPSVQDVPSSLAGEAFTLPFFKRLTQSCSRSRQTLIFENVLASRTVLKNSGIVFFCWKKGLIQIQAVPSLISLLRFLKYHTGEETFETPEEIQIFNLKVTSTMNNGYPNLHCSLKSSLQLPPWLCQPYVRPPPDVYLEKMRSVSLSNPQLIILLGFSSFLFSLLEIDFIL